MFRKANVRACEISLFGLGRKVFFEAGSVQSGYMKPELYEEILQMQERCPVPAFHCNGRHWWLFCGSWYVEDEGLEMPQVLALIHSRKLKEQRRLQRATAIVFHEQRGNNDPIPDDVRAFVFNRDKGRCVKCGSNSNIQFDHIIPRSFGGSNGPANVQLLCEGCNKSKGAAVI